MQRLGDRVAGAGSMFADLAILGPVAWHGASTPLMVSDVGAPVVAGLLQPAKIDVLDEPARLGHGTQAASERHRRGRRRRPGRRLRTMGP